VLPDEGGLGLDVVAEYLPGSAGLAAWLDQRDPAEASDYDLPAVAAGWRRVAAWAQAREFAAIAQIAARSAARHEKAGLEEDGRPAAVTPDAAAQVGLALALSPGTAEWWTSQAVTLTWRLPGTGAALAAGEIDAYRARLITEATSLLDEDTARAVEDDVLPGAGELTYAQLRARLRRAVIIADPEGAEDRRKASERRARVSLYPDDDGTATLTGTSLPAPHAAAAMARITALARALKASGAGGGTDLLRAHIYLGLLLGTLPPIPPPADGGQPDEPTDDDQPPDDPPRDGPGAAPGDDEQPGHGQHGGSPPGGSQRPGPPRGSRPPRSGQPPSGPPPRRDQASRSPAPRRDEVGGRADGDLPSDAPLPSSPRGDGKTRDPDPSTRPPRVRSPRVRPPRPGPCSGSPDPRPPASRPPGPRPPGADSLGPHPRPGPHPPGPKPPAATLPGTNPALATSPSDALPGSGTPSTTPAAPGSTLPAPGTPVASPASRSVPAGCLPGDDGGMADFWPEVPPLTDADAPDPDDGYTDPPPELYDDDRLRYGEDPLDLPDTGPVPAWPPVPGTTSTRPLTATGASASSGDVRAATSTAATSSTSGTGEARAPGSAGRNGSTDGNGSAGRNGSTDGNGSAGGNGSVGRVSSRGSAAGEIAAPSPASGGWSGAGMLDLTLSWATFAESASVPGMLGRIGPVTAAQARALAAAASTAPGTRWRVILTDHHGHAIKTATITRPTVRTRPAHSSATRTRKPLARTTTQATQARLAQAPAASTGTGPMLPLAGPHASLTGRVSVTIPAAALDHINAAELAGTSTRAAILRAAARAAAKIRRQATADQEADAGCAHTAASPSYRPPPTIRDLIEARDQTCRFPGCRQPAWRGDLDHTTPYHCGGLTCPCNLGPLCRRHHQLKQQRHWALTQTQPGTFRWQTSAGRIHITTAPRHAP
jgi:hypothetical protein